jgi:hypothetical protein
MPELAERLRVSFWEIRHEENPFARASYLGTVLQPRGIIEDPDYNGTGSTRAREGSLNVSPERRIHSSIGKTIWPSLEVDRKNDS